MPDDKRWGSFTEGVGDIGEWLRNIIWGGGRGEAVSDWARGVGSQFGQAWKENRFPSQPRSPYQERLFGYIPLPSDPMFNWQQPQPQPSDELYYNQPQLPEQGVPQPGEGSPRDEYRWEEENIGGQDYLVQVYYDENGRRTMTTVAPQLIKKELSKGDKLMQDYYDLQRQKELMQFQRDLNTPRPQVDNTALAQQSELNRQWELDQQRVQMAGQFEKARQEILSSTAPRDWVIREKAIRAQNPFGAPATAFGPTDTVGSGAYARSLMGAPEIPEDIRQFVGAGTGAEKEFGTQIAPPSGQQWTSAPWDTREKLAGYAESFGEGGYQNLLEEIRRRQPYNPSRGAMWSPTRQR